uniref:ankyrin repeat domain-containing protein n=1 Tax=Wolbachia endosymbiont (group B) of Pilophorus perplexus TaxID=3066160 RepID=UPI003342A428
MPKRKQGEVDNEGVQDFELIELLIRERETAPSTSTQRGNDFESFKARFQSYIDQIPSYLHSVGKEGFFPHFFLGSFSTLIDTEIAKKLDIEKIYFRFDGSKTLKVTVTKKGEIKSSQDAIDKVNLFVIADSGSKNKEFSHGELEEILSQMNAPGKTQYVSNAKSELEVKLVEISKNADNEMTVEIKNTKLDKNDKRLQFTEIKKGKWNKPENDIAKLTNSDKKEVEKSLDKVLKKVSKIHSEYKGSLIYADKAREAAHHGFMAGALVNFRYRYNLRVYLEQFAGRGYADIVLVPRGEKRALDAIPIIIEMKAATKEELKELEKGGKTKDGSQTTPAVALKQAEDYTKGFQPNVMRVLTTANDILCVGVNLDYPSAISDIATKSRDQEITPLFNNILESIDKQNNGEITQEQLKTQIQENIERIYHTFPGTGEKGDSHYFSRFLSGQSLLLNEVRALGSSFRKHVFIYGENIPTEAQPEPKSQRLKDQKSKGQGAGQPSHLDRSHGVVTMVFIPSNDQKSVCAMNIVETGGRDNAMNKGIPLDKLKQEIGNRKIVELNLNFNIKKKSKFEEYFSVEVGESVSLEQHNGRETNKFEGNFKDIPYPAELKETFDAVLESQLASSQDQSQSIGKYKELFGKLGEAVLPFKVLIEREAHTQAVFHGAFSHYSDIKLGESQENRALVLTEFQTGRGKRIDMVVHGIKFADQASSAKEYDPVGLELKGPREGKTADALVKEANDQINTEYVKGVTYKTLTDGKEVAFMGVVFDKGANSADSLILMSKDEFASVKVIHSSIFSFSQQQCSKGRKQRSTGMACIDSRDEEEITKEEKERFIKELFGIEAYDTKIITIDSPQVRIDGGKMSVKFKDNDGNDKELIIDDAANIKSVENYILDKENLEIKLKVNSDKEYAIIEEVKEQGSEYYLRVDDYRIKLDSIFQDGKEVIFNKLHQLSNDKQLLENKKYIEDIGGVQTNQDYNNIVEEIKQNLLAKGVREDTFDRFKSHFDDLGEKVFADYISNVESSLQEKGIAFNRDKFDSAKIKGAKGGKFFSMMAIYDLLDSIGDTATLGRHNNDALKQVFGINGILDAMDDVRTSVSISPSSKVGKLIGKIPGPARQAFVKVISNPVVQSITFATIAYQFGYSINEITQGNHHPLNYYWTASSSVKLASMSIRPMSTGISFAIKSVSTATKILRGLSIAGKVLGKVAVVTMVADVLITIGVEIDERMEYTKAIAEQIPLLPGNEQAEVFFAKVIRFFTGRDVEKEYEDKIRIKGYLNHVKEVATQLLNDNYNIAAVVQYVISIEEKYSEIIKNMGAQPICIMPSPYGPDCATRMSWICDLEKKYDNISFDKINTASNVKNDLSSLNISKTLPMKSYTLVMSESWERFVCEVKNSFQCHQELNEKEIYVVNTNAKHIPHMTKHEYEDLGLRIVNAPLRNPTQRSQCSKIINTKHTDDGFSPCNTNKIHRNCQETFTLSGEPFIFTNPTRKSSNSKKEKMFLKDSVLYISGPKTLTAAANYPAVMHIPEGSNIRYIGSKNNETIFIIDNLASGTLEGGVEKENVVVMNVKTNNVVADLHNGTIHYGSTNYIKLTGIYNYVSNSDSKQNITTHCRTKLINAKNAEVQQNSFNCTDKDYEVRVVNKEDVHHRGLKQTIFIVNENSNNAKIVSDLNYTEKIKKNVDVINTQVADITWLKVGKSIEGSGYNLDLLSDRTQNVVSSIKIDSFKNLIIQAKRLGIIESIIVQDKSLSDMVEDAKYQKLNDLGKDIDEKIMQNSEKKLKAVIQVSILDFKWANIYQIAKGIANYNNLGIPVSQIEVVKNYMGVPNEKTIIADMYSDQIIVDFGYNNSNFIVGGTYYYYRVVCNYYQDITVEGRKGQDQYVVKLPEYNHILQQEDLRPSIELDLNLKIKNKAVLYQNIPDDIIDLTALNVADVNSINVKKGRRSYFNKCDKKQVSDLTVDSLEIKDVKISISKGVRWSLSIGLVDYFRGPEYQSIVLRINNKFYKINNANLKLEPAEVNTKPFKYYQPGEQELQIYHNQPINKNIIGLVDLKEKSILDFDVEIVDNGLLLLHKNNTITKVENWDVYQPARKMIFAFNDTIVSDSNCIAFTCNSNDIIEAFNKAKETLLKEQLFNAIKQDNINEVKSLIRRIADNVDVDIEGKHELISLHIAIQEGRLDVVKLLFNRGSVNVEDKDIHGYSPLHWAAQEDELGIAEFLVDKGINTKDRSKDGNTPSDLADHKGYTHIVKFLEQVQLDRELLTAAGSGDLNKVKNLIKQGASLKAENKNDLYYTPLHYASLNGSLEVVKYFIENGADSKAKDLFGRTPVHVASLNGSLEVVKYFIENRADLEIKDNSNRTLLHYAALNNHLGVVKCLIKHWANIEAEDNDGRTPLHYAALYGYTEVVEYLIENGADLEVQDNSDRTPLDLATQKGCLDILKRARLNKELLIAVESGDFDKVEGLIKDGASLEVSDRMGKTPLHKVSWGGRLKAVVCLAKNGANLDAKDRMGKVPLHYASERGNLDVVEYLVQEEANLEAKDDGSVTPLHYASLHGHLKVVEYLIKKGANINAKDKGDATPLYYATLNNRLEVVKYLIKKGADLEAKDNSGKTPLDLAAPSCYMNIQEILKQVQLDKELLTAVESGDLSEVENLVVNKNADVNTNVDKYDWTPLHFAASGSKFDIVKFLFDKNANIKAKDMYGNTPLHVAAQYSNNPGTVEFLLDKNAEGINDVTNDGWTPLHVAVKSNKSDTVKLLLDRGASIGIKDKHSRTPLHDASRNGHLDVVRYLIEKGVDINAADEENWTPLHCAVSEDHLDIVKHLINNGANFNAKNSNGKAPLDIAIDQGYDNIKKYLEKVSEEKGKRRRRHHHGDHDRHHMSRKPLAIDLSNQPEIAASSGTRPSSWINNCISWAKKLAASTFSIIPALPSQYNIADKNNVKSDNKNIPQSTSSVGWNKFLNNENIALASCVADALDNTPSRRYQGLMSKGVEVVPSSRVAVEFALKKFNSFVEDKIRNLESKEQARIHVELKDAYPEIIASLERGVEFSGNVGLDNVLEKCKKCFCTNVLPKDKVSTCLSEIGVTKLGNTLSK